MRLAIALAVALCAVMTPLSLAAEKKYEANWASLDSRPAPQWYTDAKFGIFIHWGVYSVPSWSVVGEYSEWYWRRIDPNEKDKRWRQFHEKNYGADFQYPQFAPMFRAWNRRLRPECCSWTRSSTRRGCAPR